MTQTQFNSDVQTYGLEQAVHLAKQHVPLAHVQLWANQAKREAKLEQVLKP